MFNIHIPRYERIWLSIGGITLVIFLVLFGIMAFSMSLNPPGHMKIIDPQSVDQTPPFDIPGVRAVGENEYRIVMVASLFMFQPSPINIPAGAKVHFLVTSRDVVHGLEIPGTNVNMMVIPGHVTEYTYTFKQPGQYLILCNEYCGTGHQIMMGQINIE
jgi:cytochrome c oxidase subunit 2